MTQTKPPAEVHPALDRWFEVSARGSTLGREIRGGLVTFATMAYILVLAPQILGNAPDINGEYLGGGTNPAQAVALVAAGTALVAGVMTIAMGVFGRFPMGVAVGLGLAGFVAYTLAPQMTWPEVMGLVVLEGLVMVVLVATGLRTAVYQALPEPLRHAIAVGIGLFLTVIALTDAGIIRKADPLVTLGVNGQLAGWPALTFVVGLLVTIVLVVKGVRGGILIGILVATVFALLVEAIGKVGLISPDNPTGWSLSVPQWPGVPVAAPDLSLIGQFSPFGAFETLGVVAASVAVFSLVLPDFFDTMGTTSALAELGDLEESDAEIPHFGSILVVDSLAAAAGGAAGVSSNTAFVESASGVGEGARTGIAAIVTGALLGAGMFLSPLVAMIPFEAAAGALVIVGAMMMAQVRHIDFLDPATAIPAFLTIVLMPLTFSITVGIGVGFITATLITIVTKGWRSVSPAMAVVTAVFVIYFALNPLQQLL